jgi:hypothetical protein
MASKAIAVGEPLGRCRGRHARCAVGRPHPGLDAAPRGQRLRRGREALRFGGDPSEPPRAARFEARRVEVAHDLSQLLGDPLDPVHGPTLPGGYDAYP